jgi:hypothetical protein
MRVVFKPYQGGRGELNQLTVMPTTRQSFDLSAPHPQPYPTTLIQSNTKEEKLYGRCAATRNHVQTVPFVCSESCLVLAGSIHNFRDSMLESDRSRLFTPGDQLPW